jgi:hypothetical protein
MPTRPSSLSEEEVNRIVVVKDQNTTLVAKMEFMQQQFRDLKDQNTAINAAQDARLSIYDDRLRTIEREVK